MKTAWWCIALFVVQASAAAQPWGDSDSMDAQRQAIAEKRQRESKTLDAEQSACAQKFAVTDCVDTVRIRRRKMLGDLNRQEARLNDLQRLSRGEEELRRVEEKSMQQPPKTDDAVVTPKERKTGVPLPTGAKRPILGTKTGEMLTQQERDKNHLEYAHKQSEADVRRADRDNRLKKHPSNAATLPLPP